MALLADGVSSLLIDGKLTSGNQGTFATVNPATEEVLGAAADADAEDMGRAIEAARRAFDDTDWSRNT
ncbi:MAG: aldehyde dehydrogenase, partial [Mycobacterium sp.]|nr:aldehyde dehydrogenase [Mycobacterium sp.]